MKKIKILVGILIVAVGVFLYAHIAKMNIIYDKNVDNSQYMTTGIVSENGIEQEFECKEDTIDGIYIKCQVIGDPSSVVMKYELSEIESGKVVAKGKYPAEKIESTKFNKITFDTVSGCRNKRFLLKLWSNSSVKDSGIAYYFQPKTEMGTKLVIDGVKTEGTIITKIITNRFDVETFCVLLLFILYIYVFMKFLYRLFK